MLNDVVNRLLGRFHRIWDQSGAQWFLAIGAAIVIGLSLYATRLMVREIGADERRNVRLWADAIQRKAQLVEFSRDFFRDVEMSERNRVELWAEAYRRMVTMTNDNGNDFVFYSRMVNENTSIPVIVTDHNLKVLSCFNTGFDCSNIRYLQGPLLAEYTVNDPIQAFYNNQPHTYVFYKQSKIYLQMRAILDELASSFFSEVVDNSISVPVIITDASRTVLINSGNIPENLISTPEKLQKMITQMSEQNVPIEIMTSWGNSFYIFYENSQLLSRLRVFPLLILFVLLMFTVGVILSLRVTKRSEQNKLWVGMSRETAHQLGTPLSSLIAWVEYLRLKDSTDPSLVEIEKDIQRLTMITERFSKIGAAPELVDLDVVEAVNRSIDYLKSRLSSKIEFVITADSSALMVTKINAQLFGWVVENLARNAVDAIGGSHGKIEIAMSESQTHLIIDVSDNGKGMPRREWERIFKAGYTTKKRGWGLGLPLCRRIISEYHNGRIFVKNSILGHGTTFRILLRK